LPARCICVFHMIHRINSDHFLEQHKLIGLRNGDAVCLPWRRNWFLIQCLPLYNVNTGFPLFLRKWWDGSQIRSCYCVLIMQPFRLQFIRCCQSHRIMQFTINAGKSKSHGPCLKPLPLTIPTSSLSHYSYYKERAKSADLPTKRCSLSSGNKVRGFSDKSVLPWCIRRNFVGWISRRILERGREPENLRYLVSDILRILIKFSVAQKTCEAKSVGTCGHGLF
jgi:hypothetical protein